MVSMPAGTRSLSSTCKQLAKRAVKKAALTMAPLAAMACYGLMASSLPGAGEFSAPSSGNAQLHALFVHPPDDARILMRWWWFGPAATKPEITRELETMKAAGIGGAEIANLYPLALDDASFHNTPFLSPEHLEALHFAGEEARRLGLRLDVTLGGAIPLAGRTFPIIRGRGQAARRDH